MTRVCLQPLSKTPVLSQGKSGHLRSPRQRRLQVRRVGVRPAKPAARELESCTRFQFFPEQCQAEPAPPGRGTVLSPGYLPIVVESFPTASRPGHPEDQYQIPKWNRYTSTCSGSCDADWYSRLAEWSSSSGSLAESATMRPYLKPSGLDVIDNVFSLNSSRSIMKLTVRRIRPLGFTQHDDGYSTVAVLTVFVRS